MLDESRFHDLADRLLNALSDQLEEADKGRQLSVDLESGILTIELEDGRQLVITKHAPTRQIWLSSPISGGLHLVYNETKETWALNDGRTLKMILDQELNALTSQHFLAG